MNFRPYYRTGLILDYYTPLQIAQALIRPFSLMTETLIFSMNFCCLCREASLIEIFGTLIRRGVSCLNTTEQENIVSHRSQAFSLGIVFSPEATETPN